MSKFVNLVGNPIDGFRIFGTYNDVQEASDAQEGIDEYAIAMEIEDEGQSARQGHKSAS